MRLALHGATGRMGAALVRVAQSSGDVIVGAVATPGSAKAGRDLGEVLGLPTMGVLVQDDVSSALLGAEVVIDFSHASAVGKLAREAARAGVPIVSGTTGLDQHANQALDAAALSVPVIAEANFSIGIQVLSELIRHAVRRLGPGFDVEIVEVHHRNKVDAPSGTAARLAQEVQAARGSMQIVDGRRGQVGARTATELGLMSLRGGDVVGDHTGHLMGLGERLELVHRATTREVFARGALFAAHALAGRGPGRYRLADLLPS